MPRTRGSRTGRNAAGHRVAGIYAELLRQQCERETEPDPRLVLGIVDEESRRDWNRLAEEGKRAAAVLFEERLAAGAPILACARAVRGKTADPRRVPMLQDQSVRAFTVRADDTIAVI